MRAAAALPPCNPAALPFCGPYRSLLTAEEFDNFFARLGKNRASRESRYYVSSVDGKLKVEHDCYDESHTHRSHDADLSKMEIMLVEDVDVRCLIALNATFPLDPQLMLAYTGVGDKHSPDLDAKVVRADMTRKWYVTEMSMLLEFPWQVEDSRIVKKFVTMDEP